MIYENENDVLCGKVLKALPQVLQDVLVMYPQLFVAGGFIRSISAREEPKDIDVFTSSLDIVRKITDRRDGWFPDAESIVNTPNTVTVAYQGLPIQFINNQSYESPFECMDKFDFTICQAAFWWDVDGCCWTLAYTEAFIQDVAHKRLVYTSPNRKEAPGGSLWRAVKFCQRGYRISQNELAKTVQRLMEGIYMEYPEYDAEDNITGWSHSAHIPTADTIRRKLSFPGGATY